MSNLIAVCLIDSPTATGDHHRQHLQAGLDQLAIEQPEDCAESL